MTESLGLVWNVREGLRRGWKPTWKVSRLATWRRGMRKENSPETRRSGQGEQGDLVKLRGNE